MGPTSTVALVQGASRGLGLQFAKILAARPNYQVIATCRNPDAANELSSLPNVDILKLDVTQTSDIESAAEKVSKKYGKLDLLINSAGILHPSGIGERRLSEVNADDLDVAWAVNARGPLMVARFFAPLMIKGDGLIGHKDSAGKPSHSSILVNISAHAASIQENNLGGWYAYRMTKCAMLMANKTLSIELGRGKKRVICLAIHPGVLDTDLSRPYHKSIKSEDILSTEFSACRILEIVEKASPKDSGSFVEWDGKVVPF